MTIGRPRARLDGSAILAVLAGDRTVASVAREFHVSEMTIRRRAAEQLPPQIARAARMELLERRLLTAIAKEARAERLLEQQTSGTVEARNAFLRLERLSRARKSTTAHYLAALDARG
jgi:hypothetical protein